MTTPLIAAAHGTRSAAGLATIGRLIDRVRARRPGLSVDLCFLDVLEPSLRERLAGVEGPAVVVPVLLSAGYHVADDIPSIAALHPQVKVARHLGPHRLLSHALRDRLIEAGATDADGIALVASPSQRPDAARDVAAAAADLAEVLARPVQVAPLDDSLPAALARMPGSTAVASYLLAEGAFLDTLRELAAAHILVADPLGAHPAIAELILERYDAMR
jgi:sirohydrochlorin ferrochelatase